MNDILSERMEKALDTIRGICKISSDCEFCPFYMGDKEKEIVCNCFFIGGVRATPDVWDNEVLKDYEKMSKKGKWIDKRDPYRYIFSCSCCGYKHYSIVQPPKANFCPNCGADMRRVKQ